MTRTNPHPMNDPKDYSMLTQPKLRLNDTVIVLDEDEGGEWAQARVVDATFNRGKKCWEYSAVVEFVDEEGLVRVKHWYCFSDEELESWAISKLYENTTSMINQPTGYYIVIKK